MIRSLPLTALSLLLGFFFIFIGIIKITPKVNEDIYSDFRQEFGRYNKVFPFYGLTGLRPLAKNYRMFIGSTEVICGAIMVLIPGFMKDIANVVLICVMALQFYTYFALGDNFERMAPSLIFGLLLVCRLVILLQVIKKEREDTAAMNKMLAEMAEHEQDEDAAEATTPAEEKKDL